MRLAPTISCGLRGCEFQHPVNWVAKGGVSMKANALKVSVVAMLFSATASAGEFMSSDELQSALCGKTLDGINHNSGFTFKTYYSEKCRDITVHYLTGKEAGKTHIFPLKIYPSGDHCAIRFNKEVCSKYKSIGNGVYHQILPNGTHEVTRSNPVDGNQL